MAVHYLGRRFVTGTGPITAAEYERARTWMLEIAEVLLPGTAYRDVGDERTFDHTGGLSINRKNGAWYCHAQGHGGYSPVGLVTLIKAYSKDDATKFVVGFLANHPGTGTAAQSTEDGDGGAIDGASRIQCEAFLAAAVPIDGTPAEAYLRSRGLEPPYPTCLGFVPYARVGEGALVGRLEAHDRIVGVQLTYLDPDGCKSLALPRRRRFNLEKSGGAGFLLHSTVSGPTLICEGLEDALSLAALGAGPVIGLPGIGALKHLELPKDTEVVVFRDGDAPGKPADKGLIVGVDHLLLEGATVKVTATPDGQDANSLLQSDGVDALRALITDAAPKELSFDGDVQRISKLDGINYDRERMVAQKKAQSSAEHCRCRGYGSATTNRSIFGYSGRRWGSSMGWPASCAGGCAGCRA